MTWNLAKICKQLATMNNPATFQVQSIVTPCNPQMSVVQGILAKRYDSTSSCQSTWNTERLESCALVESYDHHSEITFFLPQLEFLPGIWLPKFFLSVCVVLDLITDTEEVSTVIIGSC